MQESPILLGFVDYALSVPQSDIADCDWHVRFVPKADMLKSTMTSDEPAT
jgi:hypothetical protein